MSLIISPYERTFENTTNNGHSLEDDVVVETVLFKDG